MAELWQNHFKISKPVFSGSTNAEFHAELKNAFLLWLIPEEGSGSWSGLSHLPEFFLWPKKPNKSKLQMRRHNSKKYGHY